MRNRLRRNGPLAAICLVVVAAATFYAAAHQHGHGPSDRPRGPIATPTAAYPR